MQRRTDTLLLYTFIELSDHILEITPRYRDMLIRHFRRVLESSNWQNSAAMDLCLPCSGRYSCRPVKQSQKRIDSWLWTVLAAQSEGKE